MQSPGARPAGPPPGFSPPGFAPPGPAHHAAPQHAGYPPPASPYYAGPVGPPPAQPAPGPAYQGGPGTGAMAAVPAMGDAMAAAPAPTGELQGRAMKKRNPLGVWLGLPIITLGIYPLVWHIKVHKELDAFDPRKEISGVGSLLMLIFLGWTIVVPILVYKKFGEQVRDAQRAAGIPESCNPTMAWLLLFAFGLNFWYLQTELNKVVDRYDAEPGSVVPLYA
ncbi:MAG: DUF4234 domain-containing protein [Gordonia sp. (in: high G+C Gram-positive bacteria)]